MLGCQGYVPNTIEEGFTEHVRSSIAGFVIGHWCGILVSNKRDHEHFTSYLDPSLNDTLESQQFFCLPATTARTLIPKSASSIPFLGFWTPIPSE